ncbi:MAG TPA: histidine kinase [Galbitalea sp.]|jgi:signal transduction histidine kinase
MTSVMSKVGLAIEPIIGVVYVLLWMNAEAGRDDVGLVVMIAMGLAIALSRFLPYVSLGVIVVSLLAQAVGVFPQPTSTNWPVYLGIAITVGLIAATTASARTRIVALLVGEVSALGAVSLMMFDHDNWMSWTGQNVYTRKEDVTEFLTLAVFATVIVALSWGSGFAISARSKLIAGQLFRVRMERKLAASEIELAVAQERNRIAHELHDVMAHSLAVVVAQADGARYLRPTRPAAVDDALQTIAVSARAALADMRGVIDVILDGTDVPQPGIDDVADLVGGIASTGMAVTLREVGERQALAPGQQLALYRILQEGLTNSLRHRGRDSVVSIVLDWRGPGVSVLLESTGGECEIAAEDSEREGRGVIGMRERAHVAGGWLAVGLEEDGTHRVTAFIPFYSIQPAQRELAEIGA